MGFIFSCDTLGFLTVGTEILRKIQLGNGIETTPPFRAFLQSNKGLSIYLSY